MSEWISKYYCNPSITSLYVVMCDVSENRDIGSLGVDFEGILEVGCCLVPTVQRHVGQRSMPKYDSTGGMSQSGRTKAARKRHTVREGGQVKYCGYLLCNRNSILYSVKRIVCMSVCTV